MAVHARFFVAPHPVLSRFFRNSTVARAVITTVLVMSCVITAAAPALAADNETVVRDAVLWLIEQQGEDGSFPGYTGEPDPGTTADAIVALAAGDLAGVNVSEAFEAASAWLVANGGEAAVADPSQAARMTFAALAVGADPRDINGFSLIDAILQAPEAETPVLPGAIGDNLYSHALSVIALAAAGEPIDPAWIEVMRTTQAETGAWAYDGSTAPEILDSNTTALVLQAFIAAGLADDPAVAKGFASLEGFHGDDGYISMLGMEADANSTAVVLQALLAGGDAIDPAVVDDTMADLMTMNNPSGAFHYGNGDESDNVFATTQAIPAVAGFAMHELAGCLGEAEAAAVSECEAAA